MKKKEKECGTAGNTDYLVTSKTQKNDDVPAPTDGRVSSEDFEGMNKGIFSMSSRYTKVAGTDTSQVREVMVHIGNKVAKEY